MNLVTGFRGKLGSLLIQRDGFIPLDCDITDISSIMEAEYAIWGEEKNDVDVVVNLAAISSIDECEEDYNKAIAVNVHGLSNLHKVFGERVLNISSDQVFSGKTLWLPREDTKPSPINNYGFTKMGAETVSKVFGGKTLRLSRTVAAMDLDIQNYLAEAVMGEQPKVPTFFSRNYVHREFAVDAIEYFVRNWDELDFSIINYGGTDHLTMFGFVTMLALEVGLPHGAIQRNRHYDNTLSPRPCNGGFKVSLAEELGFPMYSAMQTCKKLVEKYG